VQDEVAHGIATALTARLAPESVAHVPTGAGPALAAHGFTPRVEAFELYLRALEAKRAGTRAGFDRAIELGLEAVALEPGYADAWAELAFNYHGMSDGGFDPDRAWYDKAEAAARKALAIDPDHLLAQFELGALHLVHGRKLDAFDVFVRFLRAAPNHPMVHHYISYTLRLSNLFDDAIRADLDGIALDPTGPWMYWGVLRMYFESGRIDEGNKWWELAQRRFPLHPRTREYQLVMMFYEGRDQELLDELDRMPREQELPATIGFYRGLVLARLGRIDEARALLPVVEQAGWADMDYASYVAALHAQVGDIDGAFRFLDRAVELGNDMLIQYETPRLFAPLHGDPRWAPFLAGVKARVALYRQKMRWPLEVAR